MKIKKNKIIFPSFEDNTNIIEIKKEKIKSSDLLYLCNYWETDKGDKYGSKHNYAKYYQTYFEQLKSKKIDLFEIGIARGSSLKVWASYFDNIIIDSIDINEQCTDLCKDYENINLIIGNINEIKVNTKYNIIIDDGSHLPSDIINSFTKLKNNVKNGGLYIIEDLYSNKSYLHSLFKYKKDFYDNNFDKFKEDNSYSQLDYFINNLKKEYNVEIYDKKICFIKF